MNIRLVALATSSPRPRMILDSTASSFPPAPVSIEPAQARYRIPGPARWLVKVPDYMSAPVIDDRVPIVFSLEAGETWFCRCGRSETQSFCDGSHRSV